MMKSIVFFDLEISNEQEILDIGGIKNTSQRFHSQSVQEFVGFLEDTEYLCGHNIFLHDYVYVKKALESQNFSFENMIDTLFLSALLFPKKPYHALTKDEKLQSDELNNPVNDAKKAMTLFYDEIAAFERLDDSFQEILFSLLHDQKEFLAFFSYMDYIGQTENRIERIKSEFSDWICQNADLERLTQIHPIAMAYALVSIRTQDRFSLTPPWVIKRYPQVEWIMDLLQNRPCQAGCSYCDRALDAKRALKEYFGFSEYRLFGGEPLQEKAVQAAINNRSLLTVFPTGGGKSIAFQVPALMSGENVKGLTVVISPLQSLMKDQVDNLEKVGITDAVTINGLLDPIERAKSIERVEDGSASILYLSPESLRSKTIEHLLLGRNTVRFVIDEAHCFSAWGQDFRVDYLYIGEFITALQKKKNRVEKIPVSCFTATAKPQVIEDIKTYFKQKMDIEPEVFATRATRTNLSYRVIERRDPQDKYRTLRGLLQENDCPTIVYVSRTKTAFNLAERLTEDGFPAKPYHGKMDAKEKTENQNAFIGGEIHTMVATSAFGMGVDKKDVGMVIHFEISDSLENYIQEAGRAGRDESIHADCYILYCEEDLNKHFLLLNQTKMNKKEIRQIWKAIKDMTRLRSTVSRSALEIALQAGWEEGVGAIETRVKTAIAALESSGYLKRGHNMPKIFADSILCKNAQEAIEKIQRSERFDGKNQEHAIRIIRSLISSRSRSRAKDEEAESRVDYIAERLGLRKEEVIRVIHLLREEEILADAKDLTAYVKKGEKTDRTIGLFKSYSRIESELIDLLEDYEMTYDVKAWNDAIQKNGYTDVSIKKIRTILNYWRIKKHVRYKNIAGSKNCVRLLPIETKKTIKSRLEKRQAICEFLIEFLFSKVEHIKGKGGKEEVPVEFSINELCSAYQESLQIVKADIITDDIEDTLFYLSRIEAIKIEGGFLVVYQPMTIERLEKDARVNYKETDYQKLDQFYKNKAQQIHIVGEYAKKMIEDYQDALRFVEDYFQLPYDDFLDRYFKGRKKRKEMERNISPERFQKLFGELSPTQLMIINDQKSKNIAVLAGPGSGKTRVLVHKLASLILMEDVKHEQLLMLTFSRAAATEFRERLCELIGKAAYYVDIKTFHAYCFDLLGVLADEDEFGQVIHKTIERIEQGEVETNKLTKAVLVIDEAQDMDEHVFALVRLLMKKNEDMRVIAVGDDDQNIFEFRGSSSEYLQSFVLQTKAKRYELLENYRSKRNLVEFTNRFAQTIRGRLKEHDVIAHNDQDGDIRVIRYTYPHFMVPFIESIEQEKPKGTVCVLTHTNDEVLQITGLLLRKNMKAEQITSHEGFNLNDLDECRFLVDQLKQEAISARLDQFAWTTAIRFLRIKYERSEQLELLEKMINAFERLYPEHKYITDFICFLNESKPEDFYFEDADRILVSTIHKAKGKEFDHVYLHLADFDPDTNEQKRALYVALTRAKTSLTIHLNRSVFDGFEVEGIKKSIDRTQYERPLEMSLQFSHKDVWLDYFSRVQRWIDGCQSGDMLSYDGKRSFKKDGRTIAVISKQCRQRLDRLFSLGYTIFRAKVGYIVYWKKEGCEKECKILLPKILLKKGQDDHAKSDLL